MTLSRGQLCHQAFLPYELRSHPCGWPAETRVPRAPGSSSLPGATLSPEGSAEALHLTNSLSPPADHLEGSSPARPRHTAGAPELREAHSWAQA